MPRNDNQNRLSAVRKMAAKKGGQVQFQIDVATEDEWNKMLEKPGIVELYSNDNSGENWVCCIGCRRWAHELCSGIDGETFTCEFYSKHK